MISWEDFEKVEIRCGTILEVHDFPQAKKTSYQLLLDFGNFGTRRSSAQVTHLYTKEILIGKQVIAVMNFPPKQIANFFSECLVLGVYDEHHHVVLLHPSQPVENGCKIG
jgi:tRNA-binding protein